MADISNRFDEILAENEDRPSLQAVRHEQIRLIRLEQEVDKLKTELRDLKTSIETLSTLLPSWGTVMTFTGIQTFSNQEIDLITGNTGAYEDDKI